MKTTLLGLAVAAAIALQPAHAEDATGNWKGTIAGTLNVFLHVTRTADGHWDGTISVPQQGMTSKVDQLAVDADHVSFALLALHAQFDASWNAQDQAWTGTWRQSGHAVPLNLTRTGADASLPNRPQEAAIAARPASYASTDVSFVNAAANVTLAGTLTVPPGKGPFPAVVLVHGSGPLDRDETVFDHKPFVVLADYLARQGIAVLRYDKRGIGKSTGVYRGSTTLDFADDAAAAITFLRSRPEVDGRHAGIIGHSEGGLIAPLVASRDSGVAFIVMLAGPGVRGAQLMVEQLALRARANGAPASVIAQERILTAAMFAILASEPDVAVARIKAGALLDDARRAGTLPAVMNGKLVDTFSTPWFVTFLRYEPGPVLQAVRQPILVLNGERDQQVPPGLDLPAIRTAVSGNPAAVVRELPGLNHLFQTAATGAGTEYFQIEETFAPGALAVIGDWITATVQPASGVK